MSGNLGIFHPSESILILNASICKAFEIIQNDIKISIFSLVSKVKIQFLNFRVGESVGERHGTQFWFESKDELEDLASFDAKRENWCVNNLSLYPSIVSKSYQWGIVLKWYLCVSSVSLFGTAGCRTIVELFKTN